MDWPTQQEQHSKITHSEDRGAHNADVQASGNTSNPQCRSSSQFEGASDKPLWTRRFCAVLFALCAAQLLGALESTVVVTSLPIISTELRLDKAYVWVGNVVILSSAATQPLLGQLCNIFGRRNPALAVVMIFTLGSAICGASNGAAMLITGRAIQGIGSGGIFTINEIIVSDLVPLRYRGNIIAIMLMTYCIGMAVGPFLGGIIVQNISWRWVFFINVPLGCLTFLVLYLSLKVKWDRTSSSWEKLKRFDVAGILLISGSTVSLLSALTWAGTTYAWSSYQVLLPLILGVVGLICFILVERSTWVVEPVMPPRLFTSPTSVIIYCTTFLNGGVQYWVYFFAPVFFQAVLDATPAQSGVYLLPATLVAIPGAAAAAIAVSKWGRYKLIHIIGFAIMAVGLGLFSTVHRKTPPAEWVSFEILIAIGSGFILNTQLPAFQAGLEESDQAVATASWTFIRSVGSVWGIAIPATIFNTYTACRAGDVDEPWVRAIIASGNAYASATKSFGDALVEPTKSQVFSIFSAAFQRVFWGSLSFVGLGLLLSLFEKEVELRKTLKTNFALEEKEDTSGNIRTASLQC